MGRTYSYECLKCGYRASVAGGPAEGRELVVQTIVCEDCRNLYDAVLGLRVPLDSAPLPGPPSVDEIMRRLPLLGHEPLRWDRFKLACPVSNHHVVHEWKEPGRCPHCDVFLERSYMPFRQWD